MWLKRAALVLQLLPAKDLLKLVFSEVQPIYIGSTTGQQH